MQVVAGAVFALAIPAVAAQPTKTTAPIESRYVEPPPLPPEPNTGSRLSFPDRELLSSRSVKDFAPIRGQGENENEYNTYNNLLLHARKFGADELLAAARRDVFYSDLVGADEDRRDHYRYELIRFEGTLTRLMRIPTNPDLVQAGVPELYEAWINVPKINKPLCILMVDPPPGVVPDKEIRSGPTIAVGGYFFKAYQFTTDEKASEEGKVVKRSAPLLMARGVVLATVGSSPNAWYTTFLPALLTTVGALTALILGLAWYFRAGDRATKKMVESKRTNPFDPAATPPPPANPESFDDFPDSRR